MEILKQLLRSRGPCAIPKWAVREFGLPVFVPTKLSLQKESKS